MTNLLKITLASLASLALAGCITPIASKDGLYATPIGNAPVTANPTAYSAGLICMSDYARVKNIAPPRVAVGRVLDYTGKQDFEGGPKITQGASLMAISAFSKAGARLVERFDTSVSELELKYANNRLIGDDVPNSEPGAFRQIYSGSIPGSDFYLVGGITELNTNIRSVGVDISIGDLDAADPKGRTGGKLYVINIGLDLRLVDTRTLEVVDVVSYQKQIIGREISVGVFDFANNNVFDIGGGGRSLEPIQLAVRTVIERAVLEMTANLYGAPGSDACEDLAKLPKGAPRTESYAGNYVRLTPTSPADGASRDEASAWHSRRDDSVKAGLRGRTEETPPASGRTGYGAGR